MEKQSRGERNRIQCRQRILRASRRLFSAIIEGYEADGTLDALAERA